MIPADYAGHTVELIDSATGKIRQAQIFVAVLGASSLTFAMGSVSQRLPLRFEPTLNQTFAVMAEHYDTTILPTRSRKPPRQGQG